MLVYSASSLETNQQRRLWKTICSLIHSTCRILNPIYVITWMLLPCFFFLSKPWNNCMSWKPSNLLVFFSYGWLHNDILLQSKQLFNQVDLYSKSFLLLLSCFPCYSLFFCLVTTHADTLNMAHLIFWGVYYRVSARTVQLF